MEYINMDKHFKISKILIRNFIFLLLFATASRCLLKAQAFGFDSSNSCSPNGKVSRRGRAQLLATIPCDLTHQAYCNLPGTAYPWHAVRRFVHENQGLMKRMYGDVRHISVLRKEIEHNEIDVDDMEMAAERYSRDGSRRSAKFMHNREDFVGAAAVKNNDVLMEPHFRPVSTTTPASTTTAAGTSTISATATTAATRTTTESSTASPANRRGQLNGSRNNNRRRTTTSSTTSNPTATTTTTDKLLDSTTTANTNAPLTTTATLNDANDADNDDDDNIDLQLKIDASAPDLKKIATDEQPPEHADDANLESNSVYAPPTSPQTELLGNGENIQIIESPHFGGLHNISLASTISTVLKVATTVKADTMPQRRPQPNRQRPQQYQQQHYQQQQQQQQQQSTQQLHKIAQSNNSPKESSNLKSKPNESERIPGTSTSSANANAVKGAGGGNGNGSLNAAGIDTNTSAANKSYHNSNSYNYNTSPTEPTPAQSVHSQLPASLSSSSATASVSALSSLSLPSSRPAPAIPNLDLLSGETVLKQPAKATSSSTATPPAATATATPSTKPLVPPVLRDSQLFQDTLKQEPAPALNARGINACPVKEEVVAPFWANNTRGEVLALLNLYPFEQYVHWEKCTHEHKQMYCRDGCRCEQQYRLHRLLAYDPHNECRGIFSDWFRFPSCCICKCYNMPMDFRATSRSPRAESSFSDSEDEHRRHPIELAEEEVKRAIYEHATEEWYRPRDELDFYDG